MEIMENSFSINFENREIIILRQIEQNRGKFRMEFCEFFFFFFSSPRSSKNLFSIYDIPLAYGWTIVCMCNYPLRG